MDTEIEKKASNGNVSNSVSSESVIDVQSAENEEGVSKEIGENSSIPDASVNVIGVGSEENNCCNGKQQDSEAKPLELEKSNKLSGEGLKADDDVGGERDSCVVIDVKKSCGGGLNSGNRECEKVCRICHLSSDHPPDSSELIQLGCGCKDELGSAHRHCAEAWFKIRGNRYCEICGEVANNVTGLGNHRFMEEWNERRIWGHGSSSRSSSERGRCWRGQPFCNFLMACLVIAFILPWFFRVNIF